MTPRPITTEIRRPNPALLGSREEFDSFADKMLALEREREAIMSALPDSPPERTYTACHTDGRMFTGLKNATAACQLIINLPDSSGWNWA